MLLGMCGRGLAEVQSEHQNGRLKRLWGGPGCWCRQADVVSSMSQIFLIWAAGCFVSLASVFSHDQGFRTEYCASWQDDQLRLSAAQPFVAAPCKYTTKWVLKVFFSGFHVLVSCAAAFLICYAFCFLFVCFNVSVLPRCKTISPLWDKSRARPCPSSARQ